MTLNKLLLFMLCFSFVASIVGAGLSFVAWRLALRVQTHSLQLSDLITKQNAGIMKTLLEHGNDEKEKKETEL